MGKPLTHGCGYDWRVCKKHHDMERAERNAVKAVFEERFDGMDEALRLSKENIEYRLHVLNDAKRTNEELQSKFVTKDTYDIKTAYYDNWCRGVDIRLTTLETRIATWVASLGILFTVVQIVLHYCNHK